MSNTDDTISAPPVRGWHVCWLGESVLVVEERPGTLYSTATPPPGFSPPTHPFVNAVARAPENEHELRQLLLASSSAVDFLERVVAAGYELVPHEVGPWELRGGSCRVSSGGDPVAGLWQQPGPFSALHGTADGRQGHSMLTVYNGAHLAVLRGALAETDNFDALVASLRRQGYEVSAS